MADRVIDLTSGCTHVSIQMQRTGSGPCNVSARIQYRDGTTDIFQYVTKDLRALPPMNQILGESREDIRAAFRLIAVEPIDTVIPAQR